ncbi:hypothetical protein Catovirus_2_282 [Catovirus CTV1]|uniref:Uncharacterized protein n=1 Tax=Catovirus CTV1 TaxID=1977631 RepID=A0A1V0SC93_9VIRU|nr:hypothetical protein Catovirus_2_282 [Catovirus CTV1]
MNNKNSNNNINNLNNGYHCLTVLILQMMAVTNAIMLGWKVKKIEGNKFVITKKKNQLTELDNDTVRFLDTIMQFKQIDV